MQQDALFYWLALNRTQGLGPARIQKLLNQFGDAKSIFANAAAIKKIPDETREQLIKNTELFKATEADIGWLEKSPHHHIITWQDTVYPTLLKSIEDSPPILFIRGYLNILNNPQIAIVGTRHPSATGKTDAFAFAQTLAEQGWIITSGLAQGIDGFAHQGALATTQGQTIAVLAHGLDQIYPPRHQDLADKICDHGGALISEFCIGTHAYPQHFPRRNRIISGLSRGVFVVEAAQRSGSLVTARYALEQNREVFAMPGSIHNPMTKGCHELLRQGACLVESAADIQQVLGMPHDTEKTIINNEEITAEISEENLQPLPELSDNETCLYKILEKEAISVDHLVEKSQLTPAAVNALLTLLEIKGLVNAVAGGYCRQ